MISSERSSIVVANSDSSARYIADWAGLVRWQDIPTIDAHFELIEHDTAHNLAVFQRHTTNADRPQPDRSQNGQPRFDTTQTKHRGP